ncbi:DsbA family protein [Xinfangfangia sp. D13-10-4-6]|nr:DsbA family protein [Pseudogemmobacter hezensis]
MGSLWGNGRVLTGSAIRRAGRARYGIPVAALILQLASPVRAETPAYTEDFAASARAWLLDNPGIVLEVFTILEREETVKESKAQLDLIEKHAPALFDSTDARKGNPEGPVVVVEFFDYACGYCRAALAELTAALEGRDDIALVLKEFPILGPASEQAARLALAVRAEHGDAAYIGFHNALLAQKGALNDALLRMLTGAAGYDFEALVERGGAADIGGIITANKRLAQSLSINGTPAFVFRDELVPGMMAADRLREAFRRPGAKEP